MKSIARFSVWAAFVALLCFVPCALGQGIVHNKVTGAGGHVLRYAPSSFFVFTFGPGTDNGGGSDKKCGKGDSKCKPVPEGGAAITYVLLAGLCCLGAIFLRFRRQAGVRATN